MGIFHGETPAGGGIHFTDPGEFQLISNASSTVRYINATGSAFSANTTVAFTGFAAMGLQDLTNWTANTYKTILSVSGKGFVAGYIGCEAGGAETHTVEFTVDGTLKEIAIVNASGERALIVPGLIPETAYTTANFEAANNSGPLDAGKTTLGTVSSTQGFITPWQWLGTNGVPLLKFTTSLLVRAKHSASITNSTATAYSALLYRLRQ
jgi:hypothetical protein